MSCCLLLSITVPGYHERYEYGIAAHVEFALLASLLSQVLICLGTTYICILGDWPATPLTYYGIRLAKYMYIM